MDTYTYPVIVSAVDVSGHAKVTNLYQQVLAHQAVPVKNKNSLGDYFAPFAATIYMAP